MTGRLRNKGGKPKAAKHARRRKSPPRGGGATIGRISVGRNRGDGRKEIRHKGVEGREFNGLLTAEQADQDPGTTSASPPVQHRRGHFPHRKLIAISRSRAFFV